LSCDVQNLVLVVLEVPLHEQNSGAGNGRNEGAAGDKKQATKVGGCISMAARSAVP
jgi:hypothetical protein